MYARIIITILTQEKDRASRSNSTASHSKSTIHGRNDPLGQSSLESGKNSISVDHIIILHAHGRDF